jgi:hypothetical protein
MAGRSRGDTWGHVVRVGGPSRYAGVGTWGMGKKRISFLAETFPKLQFLRLFHFLSSYNLTGGSGLRGKADPN